MAERRSFFSRLFTGIGNLFRGTSRPPPAQEYPFGGRLPVPPPEPVPTGPFGFPAEEEAYPVPVQEPEMFPQETPPDRGMYVIQGDEDYYGTKEFWAREVEQNDVATLEDRYGVGNIGIIHMLIVQGAWDNQIGSEDWRRFRDEYLRQFGYAMSKYSPAYGR